MRLLQLSRDRQANIDEITINQFASSISGFSQTAIDLACEILGAAEIGAYETRWPEKAKLLQACREAEQTLRTPPKRTPFCPECENEDGYLFYDRSYGGQRLRGEAIAAARYRYPSRCHCGGSYRRPREEKHYTMADVMRIFDQRQAMRAKSQVPPPLSEME